MKNFFNWKFETQVNEIIFANIDVALSTLSETQDSRLGTLCETETIKNYIPRDDKTINAFDWHC